jgi:hypothetical protein
VGSKKVSAWVIFFQRNEGNMMDTSEEIGQYSCTKLLREMEVVDLDV